MLRVFTKDVGKFKRGDARHFPRATWEAMANNLGCRVDDFSVPVDRVGEHLKDGRGRKKRGVH